MGTKLATLLSGFLFLFICSSASATTVQWKIEGSLAEVNTELDSRFSVGQNFSSIFTFNLDAEDDDPNTDYWGRYYNSGSVTALIGDYSAAFTNLHTLVIDNHEDDQSDMFSTTYADFNSGVGEKIGDYCFIGFNLYLNDLDGIMLSSIDIPRTPPDISLTENHSMTALFGKQAMPGSSSILGASLKFDNLTISPVTPVPEPSTFLLLGGGLAGIIWSRRRQR